MKYVLTRAKTEKLPIEMIYLSEKGKFTKRKIYVYDVTSEYVRAYCYLRKKFRLFKMKNILSAMPVKRAKNVS